MKTTNTGILMQNKVFLWVAAATGLILLIPAIGRWDWDVSDFIIIAALLFGTGSLFVLTARKIGKPSNQVIAGLIFLFVMLWLWAELAVGIFTTWGS